MTDQMTDIVVDIITEKAQAGEAFTAFDITMHTRTLTDDEVGHSEVNEVVSNLSLQSLWDYNKTSIKTPGGKAWLYHPKTMTEEEIDEYEESINVPNAASATIGKKIELD